MYRRSDQNAAMARTLCCQRYASRWATQDIIDAVMVLRVLRPFVVAQHFVFKSSEAHSQFA